MRLLLTGGAGYVGSACLRYLLGAGYDVIAFDDLSEGNAQAVPADRLVVGDICDFAVLVDCIRATRPEAVLHFAALASVPDSVAAPDRYWETNLSGTRNVLDAMRECEVDTLVFSSTAAVYGLDNVVPLSEEAALRPEVPYGTSKLAAEHLIRDYVRAYGMGAMILRYFNAAGADPDGEHGEDRRCETHLIPLILAAALRREEAVDVFGTDWNTPDGTCVRDYVHVLDLAAAHRLVLESVRPGATDVYNVGSGVGTSVLEVLQSCEKAVGRPIPHRLKDRRPGDPPTLIADPTRLERELGWAARFSDIDSIASSAWEWHRRHPDGYPEPG